MHVVGGGGWMASSRFTYTRVQPTETRDAENVGLVINSLNISLEIKYFTLILLFFDSFSFLCCLQCCCCCCYCCYHHISFGFDVTFLAKRKTKTQCKDLHQHSFSLSVWYEHINTLVRLTKFTLLDMCLYLAQCFCFCF